MSLPTAENNSTSDGVENADAEIDDDKVSSVVLSSS